MQSNERDDIGLSVVDRVDLIAKVTLLGPSYLNAAARKLETLE
jgi:hypothetical protein